MSEVMIRAQSLSKRYGSIEALTEASFEVKKGEIVGFLGPNGAGKTTTMKILTCFISPTSGRAEVAGCDTEDDPVGARRALGYLPEHTPLYTEMLVAEYLEYTARMRGLRGPEAKTRIKRVVEETDLGPKLGAEIRALSKGYRQRVGLAQALVHEPPILILDEPLSGLDPNQASGVRDLIRALGRERTVILSTHNLAEVQITCDRVLIIAGGKLVADDTPEGRRTSGGRPRLVATLRRDASFDSKAFEAHIGELSTVETVRALELDEPSEIAFEIVQTSSADARADVFRSVVERGAVLLGLERRGGNLEDVFRSLTTEASKESP
jgi:ABC-2 type transport system ATP-binding protein